MQTAAGHANGKSASLTAMSVAAMGVVYGDIGTSPLYTMKEVFSSGHHPVPVTPDNVLGILSLVFWALTITVSLKYVMFITRADNKGEGGIMALTSLALRVQQLDPRRLWLLSALGIFGAALFYGDAAITPALSVLSAVEGLEVATPAFKPYVVPIAIGILVGLFMFQRQGTASVAALFGPVMLFWFATLAAIGVWNVDQAPDRVRRHQPLVCAAFLLDQWHARLSRARRRGAGDYRRRSAIRRHGALRPPADHAGLDCTSSFPRSTSITWGRAR